MYGAACFTFRLLHGEDDPGEAQAFAEEVLADLEMTLAMEDLESESLILDVHDYGVEAQITVEPGTWHTEEEANAVATIYAEAVKRALVGEDYESFRRVREDE